MTAYAMSMICEKEEVKPAKKGPAVKGGWHKYSMQSHVFSSLAAMPRAAKVQVGLCPATMGVNGGGGWGGVGGEQSDSMHINSP